MREEGVELNEIGVLFRAAWHSNELEIELNSRNIPFVKFGGIKFTEAAHVKDLLAFGRVLANHRDTVSWLRLLLLFEGLGPKSAQEISNLVSSGDQTLNSLNDFKKKKYGQQLIALREHIIDTRDKLKSPTQQLESLLKFYFPLLKLKHDDYLRRIDDLNSLVQMSEKHSNLEDFLDDLTLEMPGLSQDGTDPTSKEDEFITLSTIHSSKGLEWHTVFLISLIDGFLPSSRALGKFR